MSVRLIVITLCAAGLALAAGSLSVAHPVAAVGFGIAWLGVLAAHFIESP